MKPIISAGAVIFRRDREGIKFLLLYHGKNYWNFPKGRPEEGEGAMAAFLREVEEETGLKRHDLRILSGFQARDRYFFSGLRRDESSERIPHQPTRSRMKIVIYYLVETRKAEVMTSHEHDGYGWFSYKEAISIAKYENTKKIIKDADAFIRRGVPRHAAHPQRHGRHVR